MSEWISVKDRLPDSEQDVLMLVEEVEVYGKHDERKHKWHNIFVGYCDDRNWLTSYCYGCEYIAKVNEVFEARQDKSRLKRPTGCRCQNRRWRNRNGQRTKGD